MLIGFFFAYIKHPRRTLWATHVAILDRWFCHIFVFVHHDYVIDFQSLSRLCFIYSDNSGQHRHPPSSSLCASLPSRRPSLLALSNIGDNGACIHPRCVSRSSKLGTRLILMVSTPSTLSLTVCRLCHHLHPRHVLALPLLGASLRS
jgi:hypothetical protein